VAQGLLDHLYQYEHQENVMKGSPAAKRQQARYELRFKSLFAEGAHTRSHATRAGGVDLEALGDRVRNNYFYARVFVGRELSTPTVQISADQ
jgi:hypothetical protein